MTTTVTEVFEEGTNAFDNGKHRSFNLMFDRLLMLEQLGLAGPGAAQ
jgi:hypothetical protein